MFSEKSENITELVFVVGMWVSEGEIEKLRWKERGRWSGAIGENEDWKCLDIRIWPSQHKGTRTMVLQVPWE